MARETEGEVFGPEEALAKISLELQRPEEEKLLTSSDLTPEEIFILTGSYTLADILKSKLIKNALDRFLLLRISRFRLGRKEMIMLSTGIREGTESRRKGKLQDLFAGLR